MPFMWNCLLLINQHNAIVLFVNKYPTKSIDFQIISTACNRSFISTIRRLEIKFKKKPLQRLEHPVEKANSTRSQWPWDMSQSFGLRQWRCTDQVTCRPWICGLADHVWEFHKRIACIGYSLLWAERCRHTPNNLIQATASHCLAI